MADENQRTPQAPKENKMIKHTTVLFKVIEIIISIFAIGLLVDPLNSFQRVFNKPRFKLDDAAFIYVTVAGYVMINTLFVICHLLGDRLPKRTMILFSSLGAILHVVAGSLIVHNWRNIQRPHYNLHNDELYPSKQYMDMLISSAVFVLLNVLAFVGEIFFTLKYSTKT
ncbi:hypothetical protein KPH14_008587 [Odynerus spinipes]|uniref:DUF7775 domain-containing protein n=1 Tax=Odynerus spinipes TaxID=1348599 RepID=A0AAD9RSD8_9HYME|nr:hypothetical protein KPH14_008587 [Odynerus spinipes]